MTRFFLILLPLICAGCASTGGTVTAAFPPAASASPWLLQDRVWQGTFDEAAESLGRDAAIWYRHRPTHAWIARYCHEDDPARCLIIRAFAFANVMDAQAAYRTIAPSGARPLDSGDMGCWTQVGVLFQWRRLVFDIYGPDSTWASQVESAMLAAHITKRMPPDVPDNPR